MTKDLEPLELRQKSRRVVWAMNIATLLALVVVSVAWHRFRQMRDLFPSPAGPIPLGALWWGALGGVTKSLRGLHKHRDDWGTGWTAWHLERGVVGAISGAASALAIFAIAVVAGGSTHPREVVVDLTAFFVGYSERDFVALMNRARSLVLRKRDDQATPGEGDRNAPGDLPESHE